MREIYETREEYEMAMRSGIGNNYILPMESNEEVKVLQEKLDIAVKAIKTVIKEEGDNIDGGMLMFLTEALAKIKEIK